MYNHQPSVYGKIAWTMVNKVDKQAAPGKSFGCFLLGMIFRLAIFAPLFLPYFFLLWVKLWVR